MYIHSHTYVHADILRKRCTDACADVKMYLYVRSRVYEEARSIYIYICMYVYMCTRGNTKEDRVRWEARGSGEHDRNGGRVNTGRSQPPGGHSSPPSSSWHAVLPMEAFVPGSRILKISLSYLLYPCLSPKHEFFVQYHIFKINKIIEWLLAAHYKVRLNYKFILSPFLWVKIYYICVYNKSDNFHYPKITEGATR